jgi:hypothetical protein
MRRTLPAFALAVCAMLASAGRADAQSVRIRVSDAQTGAPVVAAQLLLRTPAGDSVAGGATDAQGRAVVAADSGRFMLAASHPEYLEQPPMAVQLRQGEEQLVELRISRTALVLDPLIVTGTRRDPRHDASRAGMLARRQLYEGRFNQMVLMHGDPEFIAAPALSDVLRRVPRSMFDACTIWFWEGELLRTPTDLAWLQQMSPQQIGAVEFYRTWHDAPLGYRQTPSGVQGSPVRCSIVAVWSNPDPPRRDLPRTLIAAGLAVIAAATILLIAN